MTRPRGVLRLEGKQVNWLRLEARVRAPGDVLEFWGLLESPGRVCIMHVRCQYDSTSCRA
jgi:hypothetical protein